MTGMNGRRRALAAVACGVALSAIGGMGRVARAADAPATMAVFPMATKPPKGAVVLFSGKAEELKTLWLQRYTQNPSNWTVEAGGVATNHRADMITKQEFGDQFIHVEFRTPVNAKGEQDGGGNSGVGIQGRYEIQIASSYGQEPEAHGAAALYSQKAAMVQASKKAGEWQTYDIIFRSPRFDGDQVTEKPRATIFFNGVLVQNNAEFNGPTGIQYGEFAGMAKTGPLIIQGDHESVQFRNIWVVPLP